MWGCYNFLYWRTLANDFRTIYRDKIIEFSKFIDFSCLEQIY